MQSEEMGSGVGGSRWNPAKEQIEMLEKIYSDEGIRTPSAEQIQQITARLRVYGHIEGKNVFYWFQNHKARQRQKQKQDRLAATANHHLNHNHNHNLNHNHINRFLAQPTPPLHHHHLNYNHNYNNPSVDINHGTTNNINNNGGVNYNLHPKPILPAPPINHHPNYFHHFPSNPNVICSPYYKLQQANHNNPSYYPVQNPHCNYITPQHHLDLMKKSSTTKPSPKIELPRGNCKVPHASTLSGYSAAMMINGESQLCDDDQSGCMVETGTLDLFPVHPTGILEHKFESSNNNNNNSNSGANSSSAASSSSDTITNNGDYNDDHDHQRQQQNLIDFFASSGLVPSEIN